MSGRQRFGRIGNGRLTGSSSPARPNPVTRHVSRVPDPNLIDILDDNYDYIFETSQINRDFILDITDKYGGLFDALVAMNESADENGKATIGLAGNASENLAKLREADQLSEETLIRLQDYLATIPTETLKKLEEKFGGTITSLGTFSNPILTLDTTGSITSIKEQVSAFEREIKVKEPSARTDFYAREMVTIDGDLIRVIGRGYFSFDIFGFDADFGYDLLNLVRTSLGFVTSSSKLEISMPLPYEANIDEVLLTPPNSFLSSLSVSSINGDDSLKSAFNSYGWSKVNTITFKVPNLLDITPIPLREIVEVLSDALNLVLDLVRDIKTAFSAPFDPQVFGSINIGNTNVPLLDELRGKLNGFFSIMQNSLGRIQSLINDIPGINGVNFVVGFGNLPRRLEDLLQLSKLNLPFAEYLNIATANLGNIKRFLDVYKNIVSLAEFDNVIPENFDLVKVFDIVSEIMINKLTTEFETALPVKPDSDDRIKIDLSRYLEYLTASVLNVGKPTISLPIFEVKYNYTYPARETPTQTALTSVEETL